MSTVGQIWVKLGADNKDLKKGLKDSENIIESTVKAINNMKMELLSISAIALPVSSAQDWARAVNDLTDKTDMAGESASKLIAIGGFVNISANEMSDAIAKMSKTAFEAADAINAAAAEGKVSEDAFTKFGITIVDSNNKLLSAEQIYQNIVTVHRDMANGLEKTAMEMQIFGRSGAKLNDLLNLTDDEMKRVTDAAAKSGLVISTETSQAWEELDKSMNLAKMQLKGMAVTIGNEMMPEMEKLVNGIGDAVEWFTTLDKETKNNIVTGLEMAGAVTAISASIKGLNLVLGPAIGLLRSFAGAAAGIGLLGGAAVAGVAAIGVAAYKTTKEKYQGYTSGALVPNPETGELEPAQPDAAPDPQVVTPLGKTTSDKKTTPNYNTPKNSKGKNDWEKILKQIERINRELEDAQEKNSKFASEFKRSQDEIILNGLDGSAKVIKSIDMEYERKKERLGDWLKDVEKSVRDAEDLNKKAQETGNAETIARTRAHLEEQKALQIDYAKKVKAAKKEIEAQYAAESISVETEKKKIQADIDAAYRANSLAMLQQYLTDEQAIKLNNWDAEKTMMDTYQEAIKMANLTTANLIANAYQAALGSLSTGISDILTGSQSVSEAFQALGKTMMKVVADFIAQKIAGTIMAGLIGKQEITKQTALSIASANAQLPAWAALASAVSLASFGANAGPAIAGMAATATAGSMLFLGQAVIPGLASGGQTTGPTLALIGEGLKNEVVLPLDENLFAIMFNKIFGKDGVQGGSTSVQINNYGDFNNVAAYEDYVEDMGEAVLAAISVL